MTRGRCPSCGQPFNGKRCRNCMYETFTEEITHGLHTHEGEPLVIDAPQRRPIRRKNPFVWDKRTRTRKSKVSWVGVALVLIIALAEPVVDFVADIVNSASHSVEVVMRESSPKPDIPWRTDSQAQPEPQTDISLQPDIQPEPQPEAALPEDGMVLLDSGDLRVVADWRDGDAFSGQIAVAVENNTGRTVWLDLEELVVNGFSMQYGDVYAEAEAGQVGEGYFYLDETEVMDAGITQFQEISFQLDVIDDETYEILDSRPVVLYPECDPDYVQKAADGGTVLLDLDGVRVSYQGCIPDYSTPDDPCFASLRLYLENNTNYPLTFFAPDGTVNGQAADLFFWAELEPHSRAVCRVSLYDVYNLGITSWAELERATLSLEVADEKGESYLTDLSPVSMDIRQG